MSTDAAMDTQSPPTPRAAVKQQFYAALDTEGLGDSMFDYPTVAVAFAVLDAQGTVHHKYQTYLPFDLSDKTLFEPRCYNEFWTNTAKCPKDVFEALVKKCRESEHKTVSDGWKAVGKAIDEIYAKFDSEEHPLQWVGDCLDYDYGRVEAYLSHYKARSEGLRYNPLRPGKRHWIEDCGSGKEVLKILYPERYAGYKEMLKSAGVSKTHDCQDDAIYIATDYVFHARALAALKSELMD